jgi:hypothetical protein
MKMSHIDEGTLHAYLDGEVSERQRAEVESHLLTCDECRARLEGAETLGRRAADLLAELEPAAAQAPSWREIEERAAARRRSVRRRPRIQPALAWAASIALAFAIGYASRAYWWETSTAFQATSRIAESPVAADSGSPESLAVGQSQAEPAADLREIEVVPLVATEAEGAATQERSRREGGRGAVADQLAEADRDDPRAAAPPPERAAEAVAEEQPDPAPAEVAGIERRAAERQELAEPVYVDGVRAKGEIDSIAADLPVLRVDAVAEEEAPAAFTPVQPEDAENWLGAGLRTLPDLDLKRVEVAPGTAVEGGLPDRPAVRLVYEDAAGHEIVLIQQWLGGPIDVRGPPQPSLFVEPSGRRAYRWFEDSGYLLILQGDVSSDSLRALSARLR